MFNFSANRKVLIIAGLAAVIVIGGIIWAVSASSRGAKPAPSPAATSEDSVAYSGLDLLIARGASDQHIDDFKFALYRHFKATNQNPKIIIISNVKHLHNANDPVAMDQLLFDTQLDHTTLFKSALQYNDLTTARLLLADPKTNKQVFDSGPVKVESDD